MEVFTCAKHVLELVFRTHRNPKTMGGCDLHFTEVKYDPSLRQPAGGEPGSPFFP